MIKIGLLEFGLREHSMPPMDVLEDVINHALEADNLGYTRFWLTEHHNLSPGWNNPEMLLPIIAGLTENMRIGIAGILLSIHSPYRVALNFKLLSNLFPGRVDLGLANGVPNYRVAQFLSNDLQLRKDFPAGFDAKLAELTVFLRDEMAHIEDKVVITPHLGEIPAIWNLRSSYKSMHSSLTLGINTSLSVFHGNIDIPQQRENLARYRLEYEEKHGETPEINIAFAGICHTSEDTAKRRFRELGFGEGYPYNCVVGTPTYFVDTLSQWREQLDIDEFIFHNLEVVGEERATTLKQVSEAFQLK
ncbi:MAG TPA: LLM class flavin-dependent oxidoreductase [Puia sp.]|nr:LLM class flavin-dependent oxidoreductase [Puia sp.]